MNHPASLSATQMPRSMQSARAERPILLLALAVLLVAIAVAVLLADASQTSEQRIAVFLQTGVFP